MRLDGPPEPIKPSDLRVECWICGGYGCTTTINDDGRGGVHGRIDDCTAPGCKDGLRFPHKVDT